MLRTLWTTGFLLVACLAFDQEPDFSIPKTAPAIQVSRTERRGEVEIRDLSFDGANGERIQAFLVGPASGAKCAGVLYGHWYAGEEPDSSRLEFLPDAVDQA